MFNVSGKCLLNPLRIVRVNKRVYLRIVKQRGEIILIYEVIESYLSEPEYPCPAGRDDASLAGGDRRAIVENPSY